MLMAEIMCPPGWIARPPSVTSHLGLHRSQFVVWTAHYLHLGRKHQCIESNGTDDINKMPVECE